MIDLYSSATPNGRKITIMLEELGIKYNVIPISLNRKEQFSDQFSKISPKNFCDSSLIIILLNLDTVPPSSSINIGKF